MKGQTHEEGFLSVYVASGNVAASLAPWGPWKETGNLCPFFSHKPSGGQPAIAFHPSHSGHWLELEGRGVMESF